MAMQEGDPMQEGWIELLRVHLSHGSPVLFAVFLVRGTRHRFCGSASFESRIIEKLRRRINVRTGLKSL